MEKEEIMDRFYKVIEFNKTPEKNECIEFGWKQGCKPNCPVYEAEKCINQRSNEIFFKWLNQ